MATTPQQDMLPDPAILAAFPNDGTLSVALGGTTSVLPVGAGRGFKSGSVGAMTAAKHVGADGTRYQVSVTVTVIGSKASATPA